MAGASGNTDWARRYGPWALVTGASDGIGREVARELAARGLNLILVARRRPVLEALSEEIRKAHHVDLRIIDADLSNPAAVTRVMQETESLEIGLLVAAAGFGTAGSFLDIPAEDEVNMLDVNCRAVLVMTTVCARRFAARGRGGIILFGSVVGFQGAPYSANYAATKAYIQTLAEGLNRELAPRGVDVLSSAPGPVSTGFSKRAKMAMGKAGDPALVARKTLDALGRTATVRPGIIAKLMGYSLALLPRPARTRIMGAIMGGMTKHLNARKT